MGRHRAPRMRTRDLRAAYPRLLNAYSRLLSEHRRLEAQQPPAEVVVWRPPPAPAVRYPGEPMGVETACALVREAGLLLSPGLADDRSGYID